MEVSSYFLNRVLSCDATKNSSNTDHGLQVFIFCVSRRLSWLRQLHLSARLPWKERKALETRITRSGGRDAARGSTNLQGWSGLDRPTQTLFEHLAQGVVPIPPGPRAPRVRSPFWSRAPPRHAFQRVSPSLAGASHREVLLK